MLLDAVHRAVVDRTPLADATVDAATVGDRLVAVVVGVAAEVFGEILADFLASLVHLLFERRDLFVG